VTGDQLINAGFNPDRGIIVGGFPCQDLSVAGKRAGLDGARSGLFWEICRLLDETKARYFILENVPGLLSSNNGRDMGAVVGALVERGYGVSYRVLDAQHFGVAQRRRRVFIVGSLGGHWGTSSEILDLRQGRRGHLEASFKTGQDVASALTGRLGTGGPDDNTAQANHLIPTVFYGNRVADIRVQDDKVNTLQARMGTGGNNMPMVASVHPIQGNLESVLAEQRERLAQDILHAAEVMSRFDEYGPFDIEIMEYAASVVRGGQEPPVTSSAIGFSSGQGSASYGLGITQEGTPPLKANAGGNSVPAVQYASTVRRLTPTECERLQGFPDGWTSERYDFKKNAVIAQADSNRYKQMGNAVAVPVVQWIISRLVEVDRDQA